MSARPTPPTVAVIGAGFSGTLVATHLLRGRSGPLRVLLVDRTGRFGAGIAYGTRAACHVLNVPAGRMSAFPDDPDHFVRWAGRVRSADEPVLVEPHTFAPRPLYGRYLHSVLEDATRAATPDGRLERVGEDAIAIEPNPGGAVVRFASGRCVRVDAAVLALGHFPPRDPPVADRTFFASERYVSWAWSPTALAGLAPDADVLFVGAGLTAVDLALELAERRHVGRIHMLSRRGLFPQAHRPTAPYPAFLDPAALPTRIAQIARHVRREVAVAKSVGHDWRAVVDALRPVTQRLWQGLPTVERRRFLRHVRPHWEVLRHRMAPEVAATIEHLRTDGRLVVHAGRLQGFREDRDGVAVTFRRRGDGEEVGLTVERVVNCTGPESDIRESHHPLVRDLSARGLIRPDPLGLGLDVAADGGLLDTGGASSSWLFTLGPLCKGRLWEVTAVPEIRVQAAALAARLREVLRAA